MRLSRVLIVDDQRDARRMFRAAIETMGDDIKVVDVPSGEEAILVISRYPIDLLITDVRLPGISGLELVDRARVRNPNLKIILVTGVSEPKLRREVAGSKADAFFFKPVGVDDLLAAARVCLGWEAEPPAEPPGEAGEPQPQTMAERLASLRQDLDALCTLLIDENGQIVAQAGELPLEGDHQTLLNAFLDLLNSASRVAHILEARTPQDLILLDGLKFDFYLLHAGASMGLAVAVLHSTWSAEKLGQLSQIMHGASADFQVILSVMGVEGEAPAPSEPQESAAPPEEIPISQEDLAELDAIFTLVEQAQQPVTDADAFWDSLIVNGGEEIARADTISFEQARQLGLAPEE